MSAQADEQPGLTFDEYLKFELNYAGDERFELDAGTVVMMTGGTERHDLMVTALFRALDRALDGGPCEVFPHNRKLRTGARSSFYPDVDSRVTIE